MSPVYRFAPSPTGYLHIGGARTAVFNWLLARKSNGKFLLRIEDTDRKRSTSAAIRQIQDSLEWLGLDWDDGVYFQSRHIERHRQIASLLLERGKAYRCFCTKEELEEKRKKAEQLKINQRYDGTCRRLSEDEIQANLKAGKPFAIRFKVAEGVVAFDDLIHGPTQISNDTLDDFIILRSDNTPVYQLAVVADDHDMGVTCVIRGDDHIANTNKQILIYHALGWPVPDFGHVPLILGADKQRLSKRHGATSVEEYQRQGILPEALFNYLCLLGWASGGDRELYSQEELIKAFSVERIHHTPAVFDEQKLLWMNGKYLAALSAPDLMNKLRTRFAERGFQVKQEEQHKFFMLLDLLKIRAKTLNELSALCEFYFKDPENYEEKGVKKHFAKTGTYELLQAFAQLFNGKDQLPDSPDSIEAFVRNFAEAKGVSAAKLIHPLRLSLTGKTASPGIFEVLYVLGWSTVVRRIANALTYIKKISETHDN